MTCLLNAIFAHGDFAIENEQGTVVDPCLPVWTPTLVVQDGNDYSFFPALFAAGRGDEVLTLNVELGEEFAGTSMRLLGYLNGRMVFRSDPSKGSSGAWDPKAHATFNVGELAMIAGDVHWYVQSDLGGNPQYVATTRLELTWIYQQPAALFENLSQARVLRLVFAAIDTGAARPAVIADVVRLCYSWFNKTYDVVHGAPSYCWMGNGGVFELGDYLVHHEQAQPVNAQDQAAILQTLLGSLGVPAEWRSMRPFGYLRPTNLIGAGTCNSPFHGRSGSKPVVDENEECRTLMRHHAFVASDGAALDACAGPREGEYDMDRYVAAVVDNRTNLSNADNTGSADEVVTCHGVNSLNFAPRASEDPALPDGMEAILGSKEEMIAGLPDSTATLDWNALMRRLCASYGFTVLNRSITPASDGVFSRWSFDSGPGRMSTVRVFSAQNRQTALSREIDFLASFQNAPAACLARQEDLGAAGLVSRDGEMAMFVHRNLFVLVRSSAGHALAVARELYQAVDVAAPRHRRTVFTHEAFRLYPGATKTFQTSATVRHSLVGNAVRLTGRRKGELEIRAQQWGISRLRLANIDDATLEMHLHQVRIEVLP